MVELLERQIELQEEHNELLRENSQLLGDVLNSLETISNRPPAVVNVGSGGTHVDTKIDAPHTSVKNIINEGKKDRGPAPHPDSKLLLKAMEGTPDGYMPEVSFFWPTGKANPGWVRVSIKHQSEESLKARVACGCLCGQPIVLKEHNGEQFYSCEALTKKGSCPYRPAAYLDKLTFLLNLPPAA